MAKRAVGNPNDPATHQRPRLRFLRFAKVPVIAPSPMEIAMNVKIGTNISRFNVLPSANGRAYSTEVARCFLVE